MILFLKICALKINFCVNKTILFKILLVYLIGKKIAKKCVLYIGIPGGYIEPDTLKDINGPRLFKIDENVGLTFKDCLIQILPLASHVSVIQRFCEEKVKFEFGQVNNALASSMWSLIKDHLVRN